MNRPEALEELIDQVSSACETLAGFAAYAAEGTNDPRDSYTLHAVSALAERIGAMVSFARGTPELNAARHLIGDELARALVGAEEPREIGSKVVTPAVPASGRRRFAERSERRS